MPTLRHNRFIPALVGIALIAVFAGPVVQTYQLARTNAENIDQLANLTDIDSKIIKESTFFFDKYRDSVTDLHDWAEDVEERLGEEAGLSRLISDPIHRGKKANKRENIHALV